MNKIKNKRFNLPKIKRNINEIEVKNINEINIEERIERIDKINLKKIQIISKQNYYDNIKNHMINYIKNNNNINYSNWLSEFSKEDYNQEIINKTRKNEIYHKIWNSIIIEDSDFEVIY
uniref:Uncharacterized protein n=1 Tax=viral metagenome TaxID=1070528 RepID=A0A6C0C7K1_9ZZZZ